MTETDKPQFAQLLTRVHAYYRQDLTDDIIDMWWAGLERYELEQVSRAMSAHASDPEAGKFCPRIADLVRVLQGTATERAVMAWAKVHEAMSRVGAYQDVVFDDPAIHAVIEDLGGWPKVCRTPLKELSILQHRFSEAHRAYVARGEFDYPRRLPGDRSPDSEYAKKGLPPPQPLMVGDRRACLAVFDRGGDAGRVRIGPASDLVLPQLKDERRG
jgi:hypothetical protein